MSCKEVGNVGKKSCVACSKHGSGLGSVYASNRYYNNCEKERKAIPHNAC
jgi:hypothetical protein